MDITQGSYYGIKENTSVTVCNTRDTAPMKQFRFTLVLSLLAAFLVSLAILSALSETVRPELNAPLVEVNPETIEYIALDMAGGTFPLYFVPKDNRWWLSVDRTTRYPLDPERFEAFLSALSEKRPLFRTGVLDHAIHTTGSDAPFVLDVVYRNNTTKSLRIGETNADGAFIYVSDGEEVYRIADNISAFLDGRTSVWVRQNPFSEILEKTTVERASLVNRSSVPIPAKKPLDGLHNALRGLYCMDITNIPHDPSIIMNLELGNGDGMELKFSALSPQYILMTDNVYNASWILSADSLEALLNFF